MMVLLLFLHGQHVFSSVEVAAMLGNSCGIQGQNYVAWLQGNKMPVGFHNKNLI